MFIQAQCNYFVHYLLICGGGCWFSRAVAKPGCDDEQMMYTWWAAAHFGFAGSRRAATDSRVIQPSASCARFLKSPCSAAACHGVMVSWRCPLARHALGQSAAVWGQFACQFACTALGGRGGCAVRLIGTMVLCAYIVGDLPSALLLVHRVRARLPKRIIADPFVLANPSVPEPPNTTVM